MSLTETSGPGADRGQAPARTRSTIRSRFLRLPRRWPAPAAAEPGGNAMPTVSVQAVPDAGRASVEIIEPGETPVARSVTVEPVTAVRVTNIDGPIEGIGL